jgi:hypothetical protein
MEACDIERRGALADALTVSACVSRCFGPLPRRRCHADAAAGALPFHLRRHSPPAAAHAPASAPSVGLYDSFPTVPALRTPQRRAGSIRLPEYRISDSRSGGHLKPPSHITRRPQTFTLRAKCQT